MSARIPELNECLLAAERMNMRTKFTAKGTPTGRGHQFQAFRPDCRPGRTPYTTGRTDPARTGALVIAAGGDTTQVNPALLRATKLSRGYVYVEGGESFTEVASYLALQMLRAGWLHDDEVARDLAEAAAIEMQTPWWSVTPL